MTAQRDAYLEYTAEHWQKQVDAEAELAKIRPACLRGAAVIGEMQGRVAELEAEADQVDQALDVAERELAVERGVVAMHARQIARLEARIAGRVATDHDGDGDGDGDMAALPLVSVHPLLLARLGERAAQADTLRAKYQRLRVLLDDPRYQPAEKVLAAAVWDAVPPPPLPASLSPAANADTPVVAAAADGGAAGTGTTAPAVSTKVYRDRLVDRTGLSKATISDKLQDIARMGLIGREARPVERTITREVGDEVREVVVRETELWLSAGRVAPPHITRADLDALADKRRADAARKRCPHCGCERLRAVAYMCVACERTCTTEEATDAGLHIVATPAGALCHDLTGEILTPGRPSSPFAPAA